MLGCACYSPLFQLSPARACIVVRRISSHSAVRTRYDSRTARVDENNMACHTNVTIARIIGVEALHSAECAGLTESAPTTMLDGRVEVPALFFSVVSDWQRHSRTPLDFAALRSAIR